MPHSVRLLLRFGLAFAVTFVATTATAQIRTLADACNPTTVDLSRLPDGGGVVTWADEGVQARLLDADGQPRSPVLTIAPDVTATIVRGFAADEDHVVFVWREESEGRIRGRILELSGSRFEEPFSVTSSSHHMDADGRDGHFAIVWDPPDSVTTAGRLWDLATRLHMPLDIQRPPQPGTGGIGTTQPEVAFDDEGRFWVSTMFSEGVLLRIHDRYGISLQGFDTAGNRLQANTVPWFGGVFRLGPHDLAPTTTSDVAVVWRRVPIRRPPIPGVEPAALRYARIDPRATEPSNLPSVRVNDFVGPTDFTSPHVATDSGGLDFVAWIDPGADGSSQVTGRYVSPAGAVGPELTLSPPGTAPAEIDVAVLGDRLFAVWAAPNSTPGDTNPPCQGDARIAGVQVPLSDLELRLQSDRFRVSVRWEDPRSGSSGEGTGVGLTDDTGAFWFFDEQNLELMVKVLDARPVNGHFWVFFGSLTDVEFTLTVTDLVTGAERTYTNPPFEMASRADTTAFDGE